MFGKLIILCAGLFLVKHCYGVEILNVRKCQTPWKFTPEVRERLSTAAAACESNSTVLEYYATIAATGKFICDYDFKRFVYCSYSKARLIDNKTGRVNYEVVASFYPNPRAQLQVTRACDEYSATAEPGMETTFKFVECFEVTSPYLVDLLP